jgi:hypothetical protein
MRVNGQIIEFRIQNHRSLRDEQILSLVAAGEGHPGIIHPAGLGETLLPVAAIYGANASGKSNVLDALAFMAKAVAFSQTVWQPDTGIPRQPHLLLTTDDESRPSMFAAQMMVSGVRYEFGFAVNDDHVVEEWLHAWPSGRKQEWYSRDGQSFDFGRNLSGENKAIEALTRPNSLFLSAAAQNNHPQLTPIYQWFSQRLRVLGFSGSTSTDLRLRRAHRWWEQFSEKNLTLPNILPDLDRRRGQVRSLLTSSDLGIEDFMVEEDRSPGLRGKQADTNPRRPQLTFAHENKTNQMRVWFELDQESTGTQVLVSILPHLLHILEEGGMLAIDELNSLHPTLALAIVQLFQDPAKNPRGAQLLFNTHESTLLGNLLSDPPPLRRDQVWLTEKDRDGATHLYPLTDFKPRPTENLQRGYLQGRYGAIPFIGSLDLTTKNESDPT